MTATEPLTDLDIRFTALLERLERLRETPATPEHLDDWLGRWSQTGREVQTLWAEHLLAIKRNSNDADAQNRYQRLMGHWMPQIEAQDEPLSRLALTAGLADHHPNLAARFAAERGKGDSEGQRALLARERLLTRQYDRIVSNKTVVLDGQRVIMREAQAQLEGMADPPARQALWHAIQQSDLEAAPALDALFTQLVQVRQDLARAAGHANYLEYAWQRSQRAYTPDEALEMLNSIAEVFADLSTQVDQQRAQALGLRRLKPWDLNVRPTPPQTASMSADNHLNAAERTVSGIDRTFGEVVRSLRDEQRFDLAPRLGKASGNFALLLMAHDTTEVVCNLTGGLMGTGTLLHELGHAIHWHFQSPNNWMWDLSGDMEICEFFAFVLQFLGGERLLNDHDLPFSDRQHYRRSRLESVLTRLRNVEERVRLELWLYQHSEPMAVTSIDNYYHRLHRRPAVDWSAHTAVLRKRWQQQQLFQNSFYNIEYSIATIAALLFTQLHAHNPKKAIRQLKKGMQLGSTQGFRAVFEEVDIPFPFSRDQIVQARNTLSTWIEG